MCVCVLTCEYCTVCSLMGMLTCQYMWVLKCIGVYICAYTPGTCVTADMFAWTHLHTYACINIHVYTHTHTHIHAHSTILTEPWHLQGIPKSRQRSRECGEPSPQHLTVIEPDKTHSRHQGLAGEGVTMLLTGHHGSWPILRPRCSWQPGTDSKSGLCCSLVGRI